MTLPNTVVFLRNWMLPVDVDRTRSVDRVIEAEAGERRTCAGSGERRIEGSACDALDGFLGRALDG